MLLLLIYFVVSVATIAYAGVGTKGIGLASTANGDDFFASMGAEVFDGGFVGGLLVFLLTICVLTSASASTQTTILPTARTSLSMGAFKAIPTRFARIHPRYLTPTDSTIWMGGVSIAFYVGMTLVSQNVLNDTIAAVGLLIAFYYGLTGFACAWYYRKTMWSSPRNILMQGTIPLLGGVILLAAFVWSSKTYAGTDYGNTTFFGIGGVFVIGIGSLLIGVVLMVIWNVIAPAYFRGETLPKGSDLELSPAMAGAGYALPDSREGTVIAPDLSNLPPGQKAIDLRTGEEVTRDDDQSPPD